MRHDADDIDVRSLKDALGLASASGGMVDDDDLLKTMMALDISADHEPGSSALAAAHVLAGLLVEEQDEIAEVL